jgi:Fe2+ or Zn2+ uptake regulation protein
VGQTVERLRSAGLRVTSPRVAVLDALDAARDEVDHHLTAAVVAEQARARLGALSTQAVYDCLDVLVRSGLARRVEPAGHPALYEARVGDNHHHLVCRGCGLTRDVDCVHGSAPCLVPTLPAPDAGFVVDEAEVTFWGWCASCVDAGRSPRA